jgi:nitronate monooxygenase
MGKVRLLFGIDLPIIQAPMAGVQAGALTIAVSNAGGLGSLPCGMLSLEAIRNELKAIKAGTNKPYNLNFFCHETPTPDAERETAWRSALSPFYKEYGIDEASISSVAARSPFSSEIADVLEAFKPPVISFHFGLPSPSLLTRVKSWGSTVISTATTLEEARWLEVNGADAIIAQGVEAGGHRGNFLSDDISKQAGTFALVPQLATEIKLPIIAAGGIADARGVAAALALGASGVQLGTAYLLCSEATTSEVHRAALKSETAQHTALTNIFSGRPARGIVNRAINELGPMSLEAPAYPLATSALVPLRQKAENQNSGDFTPMWCGQNASGCKEISADEMTRALASEI